MSTEPEAAGGRVSAARRRPVGGLLRTRNFGLFWAGESISGFGSAITTVALPLVAVSTLHASTGLVALLTAANWLPWLLIGLPAGTWVDRWPRRRTLLAADLVSAAVLAAVPIAAWTGVLTTAMLLAAVLAAGTSSMFFTLACNAYLPHLLPSGDRLEGNAKLQTSAAAAQVAGPGLGGLLTQVAGAVCGLLIDALTFVVSAACLLSLRTGPEPRPARADRPRMVRQIAEGLEPWRHGGFLLPMLAVAAMINFGMLGVFALRIVYLVRTDGAAAGTVGALISVGSLGAILGAALASRTVSRFGSARTYLAVNVATAPFMLLLPASGPGWRLVLFATGSVVVLAGLRNVRRHHLHLPWELHSGAPPRPGHGGHGVRRLRHCPARCGHRSSSGNSLRDPHRNVGTGHPVRRYASSPARHVAAHYARLPSPARSLDGGDDAIHRHPR